MARMAGMRLTSVGMLTVLVVVAACGSKSSGGAGTCVDVAVSSYDTSCESASDCTGITVGDICSGYCACPNAFINRSSLVQYQKNVAGLSTSNPPCECPASGGFA